MEQCILEKLPGELLEQAVKAVGAAKKGVGCVKAISGDDNAVLECAKGAEKIIPGLGIGIELGTCNDDCNKCNGSCDDEKCHCCTGDKTYCENDDWFYGIWGISVKKTKICDLNSGRYLPGEKAVTCALCEKCVAGAGGAACVLKTNNNLVQIQRLTTSVVATTAAGPTGEALGDDGDLTCDECLRAKDPNELFGPAGDLLPGQLVTYTITYENVGAGEAFDVFVVDALGEHFDLNTVTVHGGGSFSKGARSIFWPVGNLAPKGEAGSTGTVSFSVRLKSGLPSGTVISNQAVVHFPSVPEETPTNSVVNVIQPLVGHPQALQTGAGQPINITLSGQDVSNMPITFALVEAPIYGTLSGAVPNLTYTPGPGFSGLERLVFTVSNGTATSRPADVTIQVLPGNDSTPPAVLWTAPANGEAIDVSGLPVLPSPDGLVYPPTLQVQFSEPLAAASVNGDTIQVTDANGGVIAASVRYNGSNDQAVILLTQPPQDGATYTVTVTPSVKDASGNGLAAAFQSGFQIRGGLAAAGQVYLPLVVR